MNVRAQYPILVFLVLLGGVMLSGCATTQWGTPYSTGPQTFYPYGNSPAAYPNGPTPLVTVRVDRVDPVTYQRVESVPQSYCQQGYRVEHRGSTAGTLLGAIIGGALGNQVGQGRGRVAATIGGAVLGGAVGNGASGPAEYQPVERCGTIETQQTVSTTVYRVWYRWHGQEQSVIRDTYPGPTIRIAGY